MSKGKNFFNSSCHYMDMQETCNTAYVPVNQIWFRGGDNEWAKAYQNLRYKLSLFVTRKMLMMKRQLVYA